jgi:hypothetical protein
MRSSRHPSLGRKDNMDKVIVALLALLGFLVLLVGFGFLFAYPTMWLVNYLFTNSLLLSVFGIAKLTVFKAWALNILCGSLVRSRSAGTSAK